MTRHTVIILELEKFQEVSIVNISEDTDILTEMGSDFNSHLSSWSSSAQSGTKIEKDARSFDSEVLDVSYKL